MKKTLLWVVLVAVVAVIVVLMTHRSNAQQAPDVNCAALSGSPMMCVKNASAFPIVGIQASSALNFGSSWIPIPGGPISPGGTAVVRFPAWSGDYQNVFVKTASGTTHTYPHVDVRHSTSFVVRGW